MTAAAPEAIVNTGKFFAIISASRGWLASAITASVMHFKWGHPFGNLQLFRSHADASSVLEKCGGDARIAVVIVHD